MREEIEYEYSRFLDKYNSGNLVFERYMDEDDYEDEHSHDDIGEAQSELTERIRDFLREHALGKYVVDGGWCVFVMTVEEAVKRDVLKYDLFIVS